MSHSYSLQRINGVVAHCDGCCKQVPIRKFSGVICSDLSGGKPTLLAICSSCDLAGGLQVISDRVEEARRVTSL